MVAVEVALFLDQMSGRPVDTRMDPFCSAMNQLHQRFLEVVDCNYTRLLMHWFVELEALRNELAVLCIDFVVLRIDRTEFVAMRTEFEADYNSWGRENVPNGYIRIAEDTWPHYTYLNRHCTSSAAGNNLYPAS